MFLVDRSAKTMMGPPAAYYCINCGHSAPQVYKTYANGNLIKLLPCKACGELIDKYVEYDYIVVAINLVLQNPMAYRHILLNSAFEGFWKLGIVFLFVEAYCNWCFQKGVEYEASTTDFYELEINFYKVLFRTFLNSFFFHSFVMISAVIQKRTQQMAEQFSYLTIWKGICLCGFAEVMKLVALIWSYSQDEIRLLIVSCLFVLSNANCYMVTTGLSQLKSFAIISECYLLAKLLVFIFDLLFLT